MIKSILTWTLVFVLLYFDHLYWLIPFYAVGAEIFAFYLDVKAKQKVLQPPKPAQTKFTWQELRSHNIRDSAWVAVDAKVYDITSFINSHPGGPEFLLMHLGRDITVPFNSYHALSKNRHRDVLSKYYIGELTTFQHPLFKQDSGFYKECCQKVGEYFEKNKLNPKDPLPGLYRFLALCFIFFWSFHQAFLAEDQNFAYRAILAILFGLVQAINSLHLMHDASHGAVGNNETWWWSFGRLTLDWMSGSSMVAWHNQHVVGHHAYTNIMGCDPDIPKSTTGDVRRLLKWQVWNKLYEYQIYYMPPLYGLLALRSRWYDVFEIFYLETNGPVKVNPLSLQDKLRQSASKLLWCFWRYFLPVRVLQSISCQEALYLFLIAEFITGYWLTFNFQVSHVSNEAEFFYNDVDKLAKNGTNEQWEIEWGELQVKSSVDYAQGSLLWTYLSGALNYQVVHHLFPGVSQYHYPKIAPIVMEIAKKYKLRYNALKGFKEAMMSHLMYIKKMGEMHEWVGLKLE